MVCEAMVRKGGNDISSISSGISDTSDVLESSHLKEDCEFLCRVESWNFRTDLAWIGLGAMAADEWSCSDLTLEVELEAFFALRRPLTS